MNRNTELEILKIDLDNIIAGMTICKNILRPEEADYLNLFKRCKSVLDRIKPSDNES